MKKVFKVSSFIVLIILVLFSFTSNIYATVDTNNYEPGNPTNYQPAVDKASPVIKMLLNIGIIVGAVGITLLGLRYVLGSANEKAEYKETMMPFIFGAVFMFSVSGILRIISGIF